jgi:MarR family 2-MHQ and catechol resistance regulon transcriptional repressor
MSAYRDLERATRRLGEIAGQALGSFGLTAIQYGVLEALLHGGPMGQANLGAKLGRGDSNMHFVASNLEKRGLVIRRINSQDARSTRVHLTPEGQRPQHAKMIRALMSPLNRQEQETLGRLCQKVSEADPVRFLMEIRKADLDGEWGS